MADPYDLNGHSPQQQPPQLHHDQAYSNGTNSYPLKDIPQPHPHDVLCGRGGGTNSHIGNTQWRALVQDNKPLYLTLPRKQKMLLSQSIVMSIRSQNPPGRFLKKDEATDLWYDVGDQKATEKTSQALREGAPTIRETLGGTVAAPGSDDDQTTTKPSDSSTATASLSSGSPAEAPAVMLDYPGAATAPVPVPVPPVIPPSVPPQGPVATRRPRGGQPRPTAPQSSQDEHVPPPAPEAFEPLPLESGSGHDVFVEPPAPLEPDQVFSFGSIQMSDVEQARLMSNYSLGSDNEAPHHPPAGPPPPMAAAPPSTVTSQASAAAAPRRAVQFGDPVHQRQLYREPQVSDYEDYVAAGASGSGRQSATDSASHVNSSVPSSVPMPVDGGLEPAGLSMGSVMSLGTTMSDIDPVLLTRLEPTGVSFGSVMSFVRDIPSDEAPQSEYRRAHPSNVAPVDYGLEAIGTSFGSMSLGVDSAAPMPNNHAPTPAAYEAQPTFLQQAVSRGNLLECSDTDDEDEDESSQRQHSFLGGGGNTGSQGGSRSGSAAGGAAGPTQSAGYEQLRAALEARNYVDLTPSTSAAYSATSSALMPPPPPPPPPPAPNGRSSGQYPPQQQQYMDHNETPNGSRPFDIPTTTFDRDFSQMSALSVDDADFRHDTDFQPVLPSPNEQPQPQPHHLPPQHQYLQDQEQPYIGVDDLAAMPPPPMKRQSSDHWESTDYQF